MDRWVRRGHERPHHNNSSQRFQPNRARTFRGGRASEGVIWARDQCGSRERRSGTSARTYEVGPSAFVPAAQSQNLWQLVAGSTARTRGDGTGAWTVRDFVRSVGKLSRPVGNFHDDARATLRASPGIGCHVYPQRRAPAREQASPHFGAVGPLTSRRRHRWHRPAGQADTCPETAGSDGPACARRRHPSRIGRRCIACRPPRKRPARR